MTTRRRTRVTLALAGALLLAGTAACADDDAAPGASSSTPTAASPTATTSTAPASPTASASSSASATRPTKAKKKTPKTPGTTATATATRTARPERTRTSAPAPTRTRKPKPTKTRTRPASGPRVELSITKGLDPDRQKVTVRGYGFDTTKGVYVALCVKPKPGRPPTPCGGGVDTTGTSQASAWISSNPPPYGASLAKPYGKNGTFTVTIWVSAKIDDSVDCRRTQCVIGARNDHTRSTDRSQDVLVPVTFRKK